MALILFGVTVLELLVRFQIAIVQWTRVRESTGVDNVEYVCTLLFIRDFF